MEEWRRDDYLSVFKGQEGQEAGIVFQLQHCENILIGFQGSTQQTEDLFDNGWFRLINPDKIEKQRKT